MHLLYVLFPTLFNKLILSKQSPGKVLFLLIVASKPLLSDCRVQRRNRANEWMKEGGKEGAVLHEGKEITWRVEY